MKLAIVGSRNWLDTDLIERIVAALPKDTVIVSGGAKGVDTLAVMFAAKYGLPKPIVHLPDYNKYNGKIAPHMRNIQIVDECDGLVAFQRNKSRGTQDSIDMARQQGKLLYVYEQ